MLVIAQYCFVLPGFIYIPSSARLDWIEDELDGERVFVRIATLDDPEISLGQRPADEDAANGTVLINGEPTVQARLVVVEFRRDGGFDRLDGPHWDPPLDRAKAVANGVLARLRVYTRAQFLPPILALGTSYWVTYLDDARAELPSEKGLVRRRGAVGFAIEGVLSITPDSWAEFSAVLPSQVTTWDVLLLDAYQLLPQIGPALVLAWTAVETAATAASTHLAAAAAAPLLEWVEERFRPGVADLLNQALPALGGQSLSAGDPQLWIRVKALRDGRNTFCHHGVATDDRGHGIDGRKAADLVNAADETLRWLEQYLPTANLRPAQTVIVTTSVAVPVFRVAEGADPV